MREKFWVPRDAAIPPIDPGPAYYVGRLVEDVGAEYTGCVYTRTKYDPCLPTHGDTMGQQTGIDGRVGCRHVRTYRIYHRGPRPESRFLADGWRCADCGSVIKEE